MQRLILRSFVFVLMASAALAVVLTNPQVAALTTPSVAAQGTPTAGPPDGLAVRVLGGTIEVTGGSIDVSGGTIAAAQSGPWSVAATQSGPWSVASAQSGPWSVASSQSGPWTVAATQSGTWYVQAVEETYSHSGAPTCPFANQCYVAFPAVPEGKVLRITRLHGVLQSANDSFAALHLDDMVMGATLFAFPVPHLSAAYRGNLVSFNTETDVLVQAGHVPILEVGNGGTITEGGVNRLGITGALIPVQ